MNASPASKNADYSMSAEEFDRIVRRVRTVTGIVLKPHKEVMVRSRISRRLRELGYATFSEYLDFLESSEGTAESINFCNAITTNLTSFFREKHHFEHLENELSHSPSIDPSRLRIWSAGCSTGEEPYSIAMTVLSSPRAAAIDDKRILATDLDTNVLAKAEAGRYPSQRAASIPANHRNQLYRQCDDDTIEMAQRTRGLIAFKQLNLLGDWPFKGPFDIIFCRNVLIYFDAETKAGLIDRYARYLKPNGVLYLGHSETILEEHPLLSSEGRTTYRRRV